VPAMLVTRVVLQDSQRQRFRGKANAHSVKKLNSKSEKMQGIFIEAIIKTF